MSPHRTLLEAVRIVHRAGYESLRVQAYFYATGHWRCELGLVGNPLSAGRTVFRYTEASEWDFFGDGDDQTKTPDQVAARLTATIAGDPTAPKPAKAYAIWYSTLLDYSAPHGLFSLWDDSGYRALTAGYVELRYPAGYTLATNQSRQFPLSPQF
jgi:hypothetical protein